MAESISVSATPNTPTSKLSTSIVDTKDIKTATKDIILFDDNTVPIDAMTDLLFEDIGGQEIINIARNDIINGQKLIYQPIKNISTIQQQYNPNNILPLQNTSDTYFAGFGINLDNRTPKVGNGPDGRYVYIDSTSGDLTIEVINILSDEQVEIQLTTSGTIYEVDIA